MKKLVITLILFAPFFAKAQNVEYNVKSYFTGRGESTEYASYRGCWLNFLIEAGEDFNYNITEATFAANSTLDWHKHATAQVLIVVEGEGYYQERGKEPVIIKKGDVIKCEKNIEHWHTSSADKKVSYIAIYGKEPTTWTEKLSREYYDSVAKKLKGN